jgi:hypothetical protein
MEDELWFAYLDQVARQAKTAETAEPAKPDAPKPETAISHPPFWCEEQPPE